ncbi:hypothetical protein KDA23_00840 [Candidatus Saccharibacteria bacterium]|nr:hypothetical protein [Candidatus Saccharibacteria bacterium]
MHRIKQIIISLVAMSGLFFVPVTATAYALPAPVTADSVSDACRGITITGGGCKPGNGNKVNKTLATVVNLLSSIVGVAAVIMIIVSGFKYITAGGDANKVSSAKSTLIYAIVGLVVVAMAQVIVRFVINRTT